MPMSLEDALLTVWRQSLLENKKTVTLEDASFPVRSTAKRKLKQIDFQFDGKELRGLEQNPDTKSRWAAMARSGKKVMQFLEGGRYIADGKVHLYPSRIRHVKTDCHPLSSTPAGARDEAFPRLDSSTFLAPFRHLACFPKHIHKELRICKIYLTTTSLTNISTCPEGVSP
jgi:hypothetical protein